MGDATSLTCLNQPQKTILFKQEQTGGITYRIPALIYIKEDQTFLAFAEKRSTPSDTDAEILVMRKGTLKNGSVQWSPLQELDSASLPNHRTMNPCPVYEINSKTLFLFFICVQRNVSEHRQLITGRNAARLCYVYTKDTGHSWSEVKDLTEAVIGEAVRDWATFAVGPGHGIQMKSGKLIIPAHAYYNCCRCFCFPLPRPVRPRAFYFYSNDNGKTWLVSRVVQAKSSECEMAEIIDSELRSHIYCNARSTCGYRVEALGESDGTDFDKPHFAPGLVEPPHGCQGSVISFPASESVSEGQRDENNMDCRLPLSSNTNTWLLFSHPTNKRKRIDLGLYLNRDPLKSGWDHLWVVHRGPSGYSDLAYCEGEGRFSCLLECGIKSELEAIAFMYFRLSDVMETVDEKDILDSAAPQ